MTDMNAISMETEQPDPTSGRPIRPWVAYTCAALTLFALGKTVAGMFQHKVDATVSDFRSYQKLLTEEGPNGLFTIDAAFRLNLKRGFGFARNRVGPETWDKALASVLANHVYVDYGLTYLCNPKTHTPIEAQLDTMDQQGRGATFIFPLDARGHLSGKTRVEDGANFSYIDPSSSPSSIPSVPYAYQVDGKYRAQIKSDYQLKICSP